MLKYSRQAPERKEENIMRTDFSTGYEAFEDAVKRANIEFPATKGEIQNGLKDAIVQLGRYDYVKAGSKVMELPHRYYVSEVEFMCDIARLIFSDVALYGCSTVKMA